MDNIDTIKSKLNLLIEGWGFEETQLFSPQSEFIQTPNSIGYPTSKKGNKVSIIYTSTDKPYDIIKFDDATLQSNFVPGIETPTLYKKRGAERTSIEIITLFKTAYGHEFPIPAHKPHISTDKDKTSFYKDIIDSATIRINSDVEKEYHFNLKKISSQGGLSAAVSDLSAIVKTLNFVISREKEQKPDGSWGYKNHFTLFDNYENSKLGPARAYEVMEKNIFDYIKENNYSKVVKDVINLLVKKWNGKPNKDTAANFRNDFYKIRTAVVELSKFYPKHSYVAYKKELKKIIDSDSNFMYSATYNVVKTLKNPITADDVNSYNNFIFQSSKYCSYVKSLHTSDPSYFDYIIMLGSGSNFNRDFANRLKSDHYSNAQVVSADKFTDEEKTTIDIDALKSHAEELVANAKGRTDNLSRIYKNGKWILDNASGYQEFDTEDEWIEAWAANEMQKYEKMIAQGGQIKGIPQDKRHSVNMFNFKNVGSNAKRVLIIDDNYVSGGSAVSAYRNIQSKIPGLEVKVLVPLRITNFAVGSKKYS